MNNFTLRQAAALLVRFFGFYILFYAVLDLTELPGYWIRSSYSHLHPARIISFDTSFDVSFLMYGVREIVRFTFGTLFFGRPDGVAEMLVKPFSAAPMRPAASKTDTDLL